MTPERAEFEARRIVRDSLLELGLRARTAGEVEAAKTMFQHAKRVHRDMQQQNSAKPSAPPCAADLGGWPGGVTPRGAHTSPVFFILAGAAAGFALWLIGVL